MMLWLDNAETTSFFEEEVFMEEGGGWQRVVLFGKD